MQVRFAGLHAAKLCKRTETPYSSRCRYRATLDFYHHLPIDIVLFVYNTKQVYLFNSEKQDGNEAFIVRCTLHSYKRKGPFLFVTVFSNKR